MALDSKQINKLFNDVYNGKITTRKLPKAYYENFANGLDKQIKKGFGIRKVTAKTKYVDNITEMSENGRLFAGGKTYHLTRELVDAKKIAKTRKEYKELAQQIYDKYERWGEAETNTMLASAQSCKKWQQIEGDSDVLTKLRYETIGDACPICAPLDGLIAPVSDAIWNKISPINHYNCICVLIQEPSSTRNTNAKRKEALYNNADEIMDDTFKNNVGKTNEAFPRHPYFEVSKKDEALARRNFDLPIPDIKNSIYLEDEPIQFRFTVAEFQEDGNSDGKRSCGCVH